MRPTPSELRQAALDPNSRLYCVFCHAPLNRKRYKDTPTCSDYCYKREYGWFLNIHKKATADLRLGREWLSTGEDK